MNLIKVKLYVEDTCNPSNQEALQKVQEIISEAFGREEMQEHPRVKLVLMEAFHTDHNKKD